MTDVMIPVTRRIAAALTAFCLLAACEKAPEVVSLPPPEVSVSQPIERSVGEYFEATGQTQAVESVDIRARVSGYLVKVSFRDGVEVKKGDELFLIDPRPYEAEALRAEADIARWEAAFRKAVADVKRNQRLFPKGAASEKDVEASIAARDSADAEIKAARAQLQKAELDREFARITAPIDGQVSRTNVTQGNLVQAASPGEASILTTIVSTAPIYVYFDIDERTILEVRERRVAAGQPVGPKALEAAKIPVEIGLPNDPGYTLSGRLDFVDNRVNPATGTIKARAVLTNDDHALTPGLFVRVRVPISDPRPSLLVTERAIGTDQNARFLYVVNEQNTVEYRPVRLGVKTDDGLRVVDEGIRAGESVIVNGVQRARPGLTVAPRPVEMLPPAAREGAATAG